jgi:hypothetical protein
MIIQEDLSRVRCHGIGRPASFATRRVYNEAFREHFEHDITALPTGRFWQLAPVFSRWVYEFRFGYDRTNGVADAADEFFRQARVGDFRCLPGEAVISYSLEEAMRFAKRWTELRNRLYQPLFHVVAGCSDDAYGDLLDSLPLAGQDVVEMAISGGYTSDRHFTQNVWDACRKRQLDELADFILEGENYIAMHLREAAQGALALTAAG